MRALALWLLTAYRAGLRPWLPPACRFHPSCGDYADESLRRHGVARGLWLIGRRLSRCHPFHPGGLDPVCGR